MTALTNYSSQITNSAASPIVKNSPAIDGGYLKVKAATIAVAAADTDGSIYAFFKVPSNAVVHKLEVLNDAITDGTDYDVGIYSFSSDITNVTAVDVNLWGDAVSMAFARVAPLDITHEAGGACPIEYCTKKVYELATLTTDPQVEYLVCATGVTVGSAAGDITLKMYYSV